MNPIIREVWSHNLDSELGLLNHCLDFYPNVSIDTEFPGSLHNTPWNASEEELYRNLQLNVNNMKLIQLGLTVFNDNGTIGSTWEFNFSDFDPQTDAHNAGSVSFLENHGLDFQKLRKFGIPIADFSLKVLPIFHKARISRWVTFHGLYDLGYLLKAMAAVDLPDSIEGFSSVVKNLLGNVSDLKHMAIYCEGLQKGKLGLKKLAELLHVERVGQAHSAGSDSLLTALLYAKMKQQFRLDSNECEGYLYGLSNRICSMSSSRIMAPMYYHPPRFPVYYQHCYYSYY